MNWQTKGEMMLLKQTVKGAIIGAAAGVSFWAGMQLGDDQAPFDARNDFGKKVLYVAYDKTSFGKSNQVQAQAKQFGLAKALGVVYKQPMKKMNGFVFEAEPGQEPKLQMSAMQIDSNWVVQKNLEYHLDFLTGCERLPEPTPVPDPNPGPGPDPVPVFSDQVPWGVAKVHALEAQKITKAENVLVCVTDTGSDMQHPDLKNMLAGGADMVGAGSWQDDHGHGTHVAGTISAELNDSEIMGVTQAKIYTVKVLDRDGSGYSDWIADGIVECVDAGAKVINMSLGGPSKDQMIADAIVWALERGTVVVAAAGNNGGKVGWPAALPETIAIAASDEQNQMAYFSSRGPEVDFIAPGLDVLSLRLGGGTVTMSGTSMASPHAAAVLALALASGKDVIKADDIGLPKEHQGEGLVNAEKSVK